MCLIYACIRGFGFLPLYTENRESNRYWLTDREYVLKRSLKSQSGLRIHVGFLRAPDLDIIKLF